MVNTRQPESIGGSGRPPFPLRPGEGPSRPSRMQSAYTLNSRQVTAITPQHFVGSGRPAQRTNWVGIVPHSGGWSPRGTRKPAIRLPPRTYGDQLAAALAATGGYTPSDYNPVIPH